jgi:predicted O-methyltransferase YrrM
MYKINQYTDIPGFGHFGDMYKELLLSLPDNASILEVGVAFGKSTWAMLDAMRKDMSLCVLDSFHNDSYELFNFAVLANGGTDNVNISDYETFIVFSKIYSHRDMFLRCISQHSKFHQLQTIYTMPSDLYILSKYPTIYDLVFLDGDHSYESVKEELEYFKDCTVVTGHDYNNHGCPGVKQAVDEFVADHPDRLLRIYDEHMVFVITKS